MSLTLKNGAMIWRDSPEINHLFQNNFKKREAPWLRFLRQGLLRLIIPFTKTAE